MPRRTVAGGSTETGLRLRLRRRAVRRSARSDLDRGRDRRLRQAALRRRGSPPRSERPARADPRDRGRRSQQLGRRWRGRASRSGSSGRSPERAILGHVVGRSNGRLALWVEGYAGGRAPAGPDAAPRPGSHARRRRRSRARDSRHGRPTPAHPLQSSRPEGTAMDGIRRNIRVHRWTRSRAARARRSGRSAFARRNLRPADEPANPAIDMRATSAAHEAAEHRESRRLSEQEFIRPQREPGVVVLDARSREAYDLLHVAGAISAAVPGHRGRRA